jgi:hypothetical protein
MEYLAKLIRACKYCDLPGKRWQDSDGARPSGYAPCGVCTPGRKLLEAAGYEPKTVTLDGRRAPRRYKCLSTPKQSRSATR